MDVYNIRYRNLLRLIDEAGGIPKLADLVETRYNVLHLILRRAKYESGTTRNVGNDLARRLEEACGKPVGWMDHDHDGVGVPARVEWIMKEIAKMDLEKREQLIKIIAAATGFAVPDEEVARRMLETAATSAAQSDAEQNQDDK